MVFLYNQETAGAPRPYLSFLRTGLFTSNSPKDAILGCCNISLVVKKTRVIIFTYQKSDDDEPERAERRERLEDKRGLEDLIARQRKLNLERKKDICRK